MVESQEGFGTIKSLKEEDEDTAGEEGEEGKLRKVEKRPFRVETVGRSTVCDQTHAAEGPRRWGESKGGRERWAQRETGLCELILGIDIRRGVLEVSERSSERESQ